MDRYHILKYVAFDVAEKEKLPKPSDIRFPRSLNGTMKRHGTCIKNKTNNNFKIIIHTIKARFVLDPNGKYRNKKGERFRRVMGIEREFKEVVDTVAHELAHLKYWKHDAKHKSYSLFLCEKLKEGLHFRGVEL